MCHIPTPESVLVSRPGEISLYEPSLVAETWRVRVGHNIGIGLAGATAVVNETLDERQPIIRLLDLKTGEERSRTAMQERAALRALTPGGDVALLGSLSPSVVFGLEMASGRELWRAAESTIVAAGLDDSFVTMDLSRRTVRRRMARDGAIRWSLDLGACLKGFDARTENARLRVVSEKVLLVVTSTSLIRVATDTGIVEAQVPTPAAWPFVVTPDAFIAAGPFGCIVVELGSMRVVEDVRWEADVRPAFGEYYPEACGIAVSASAVVWTTPFGDVMGVSRRTRGTREVWVDRVGDVGGFFGYGQPISCVGNHIYVAPRTLEPVTHPFGLYCYGSSAPGEASASR
jgi:hypothetical protein